MLNAQSPYADSTKSKACLSLLGLGQQANRGDVPFGNLARPNEGDDASGNRLKPVEDFLASEMSKLSVQERSKALDDVHCVGDELHEAPEVIENSLREFECQVQREKNPVYEMAVNQNRAYIEDPEFRMKFLRANLHNVGKSVRDMLEFLSLKATYFGNEKLARDITIDDLDKDDKEILFSGFNHIQDGTDRMGRVIFHSFRYHMGKGETGSHIRAMYYIMFNILAAIPAAQKKGVVYCYYGLPKLVQSRRKPGLNYMMNMTKFLNCIPVRQSAHHICLRTQDRADIDLTKFILGLKMFSEPFRARTRIHCGTDLELQYELQYHGFPMNTFPVDTFGNVRQSIQYTWLHKYHAAKGVSAQPLGLDESNSNKSLSKGNSTSGATGLPPRHDILLGRGRPNQSHPGNVCFREYLKQHSEEYDQAPRNLRRKVLGKIREDLKKRGIRFLQDRNGTWVECTAVDAEKTIAQAFRNLRKKSKKEENAA